MTITFDEAKAIMRKPVKRVSDDEKKAVLDYFKEHEPGLLAQVINSYTEVEYFAKHNGRTVLVLDNTYDVDDIKKSNPELYPLHTRLTCPFCHTVGLMSIVSYDPPLGSPKLRPRRKCFACWHTTIKEILADRPADYGKDLPVFKPHKWTAEELNSFGIGGHDFED